MPARRRITSQHKDTLEDLQDRHARNPLDPAIKRLIEQANHEGEVIDNIFNLTAAVLRTGPNSRRSRDLDADRRRLMESA